MQELKVAISCSSNMNRSMEAHDYLAKKQFTVKSFGTGDMVRLPGESADRPNCYPFGTPYSAIFDDLTSKGKEYYSHNGLLGLIERNRKIKPCPERLQDSNEMFDVIITCEERVFNQVLEWIALRESTSDHFVHIVNVEIEDNMEDATIGSFVIFDIVNMMSKSKNLDEDIHLILQTLEARFNKTFLYSRLYY